VLKQLRDLGNTVIVVEHDEDTMRAADQIIDIGPRAGYLGGKIVYSGDFEGLLRAPDSLTADYLTGRRRIDSGRMDGGTLKMESGGSGGSAGDGIWGGIEGGIGDKGEKHCQRPDTVRKWRNYVELKGVRENNLKGVDVRFPLGVMTCVTGVSGSGKSSLVRGVLYPALKRRLDDTGQKPGSFVALEGDVGLLTGVEMIDQNPIGRSSRSNPVTYIKAYDEIRKLFADQPYARHNGMPAAFFSFNTPGGRCEECQGEGVTRVEMQFMADVELVCETCGGKRFKDEVLEVRYRGKNIFDVLEMTVDEAIEFFKTGTAKYSKSTEVGLGAGVGAATDFVAATSSEIGLEAGVGSDSMASTGIGIGAADASESSRFETEIGTVAGSNSVAEAGTDADLRMGLGTNTSSGTDEGSEAGKDVGSETGTDMGLSSGTSVGLETEADSSSGVKAISSSVAGTGGAIGTEACSGVPLGLGLTAGSIAGMRTEESAAAKKTSGAGSATGSAASYAASSPSPFAATCRRIVERLGVLQSVGLGYIKLGQSSSTLSGGESQRVKLASFLLKDSSEGRVMFIFDEPTTGLHFHDINKLLKSFNALIAKGHTVIVIEHNPDVIRLADHVIDLGPEGGEQGGSVVFEGTPAELENCTKSYTGRYLATRKGRS
jgi:ABC-type lipoprotein export system ATPase subunit